MNFRTCALGLAATVLCSSALSQRVFSEAEVQTSRANPYAPHRAAIFRLMAPIAPARADEGCLLEIASGLEPLRAVVIASLCADANAIENGEEDDAAGADARQLHLRLSRVGTNLHLEGTRRERLSWWRAFLAGSSERVSRQHLRAPVDAHLAALLGEAEPLGQAAVDARSFRVSANGILAVAGAFDGGRRAMLLTGTHLRWVSLDSARAVVLAQVELPADPHPFAHPPTRGSLVGGCPSQGDCQFYASVAGRSRVLDVRVGEQIEISESELCPEGAMRLRDACTSSVLGRDYLSRELRNRAGELVSEAPISFYGRTMRHILRADGTTHRVELATSRAGRLVWRQNGRDAGMNGFGAALASSDLDLDGQLEVLACSDNELGEGDELRLLRVLDDGGVRTIWTSEALTGSVLVAGEGDIDGDGIDELLAVESEGTRSRIWVVQ